MAGNPNPSPATRFKPGNNANPGGVSSKAAKAIRQTGETAALVRSAWVSAISEKIRNGADPLELMNADSLRLLKDSEDRAHGTPKQAVDVTSSDGTMTPKGLDLSGLSVSALRELAALDPDK